MKEIERRLARSSFGDAEARRARKSVPAATAARIVARSKEVQVRGTREGGKARRTI